MTEITGDIVAAAEVVFHRTNAEFEAWVPFRGPPDVFDQMERAILSERTRIASEVEAAWSQDMSFPEVLAIIENRK